jgi:predicted transcriptional regulator
MQTTSPTRNNAEKLRQIYNHFDYWLRKKYNQKDHVAHYELIEKVSKDFCCSSHEKMFLKKIADLRNVITHNNTNHKDDVIAEPFEETIDKYEKIVQNLLKPPKAFNYCVKSEQIYKATLDFAVKDILHKMTQCAFSYVPVVENNELIGIFSEHSIFAYMARIDEDIILELNQKLSTYKNFISFDSHPNERFEFISRETPFFKVQQSYHKGIVKNKRLGAVLITENGKPNQKLLGLLTPWDILQVVDHE